MPYKRRLLGLTNSVQTIPVHLNASRSNAESFSELAREVELFPRKVASALRIKAEPPGFFAGLWTGIEEYVLRPPMLAAS